MEGELLTKKERRELKRQEKTRDAKVTERRRGLKKLIRGFIILGVIVLIIWSIVVWAKRQVPQSFDYSRSVPELSGSHIVVGQTYSDYNSNPPTSGSHWPDPLGRGIYDEEQPDEILVHNLEHGEIWIAYHPRISEETLRELTKIAKSFNKIVMAPRSKNDMDIALAAWSRLDAFNLDEGELDKKRIEDFIKRYRNKGPELVP